LVWIVSGLVSEMHKKILVGGRGAKRENHLRDIVVNGRLTLK
jgi:hypothetical protein